MPDATALLQPFTMRDLEVRNRVALAPMTRARASADRTLNALMAEYYAQRASAGLIITKATTVSALANGWTPSPGLYPDAPMEAWYLPTGAEGYTDFPTASAMPGA